MNNFYLPNPANNKRLQTPINYTENILYYGLNNVYPQEMEQLRLRSPLVKSSTEILEDFINGTGWEENEDKVINELGDTTTDVLNLLSMDYARYNGFALHIDFDATGNIVNIANIPFEYCRLGTPNALGIVKTVVLSNNWEQDPSKLPQGSILETVTFPLFNPLSAAEETISGGSGQILYYSGLEKYKYPLCTFDAIINTAESDEAVQLYERNNVKLGFHGTTIFKYPSKFESEEEEREVRKLVEAMNGAESPGVVVAQIDEDFSGELLETIPSGSDDTLFTATLGSILDRVLQNYRIPPALMGTSPDGAIFSQAAYLESFTVYNVTTRNRRNRVSRIMNSLTELWSEGSFNVGRILENRFDIQGETTQVVSDKITTTGAEIEGAEIAETVIEEGVPQSTEGAERVETEGRSPEELQSQANLRGSVGGVQGILGIQTAVSEGTTPYASAVTILVEVYGFTEEVARELLGEEKEIETPNLNVA